MARRRKAAPVSLTAAQRERLERLWFIYGNYGPKTTPGNHQFIQGLLEHGLDLRPLQTKRTPKSELPTEECEAAVDAVLSMSDDDAEEWRRRAGFLRLASSARGGREATPPDPEPDGPPDEIRSGQATRHDPEPLNPGGKDAA